MDFNINQQNGIFVGGGLIAYLFSGKLGPLKTVAQLGGLAAAGLGVADILGIFKISQVPVIGGLVGGSNFAAQAYAATTYDPNNFYLPPRDASIAP